MNLRVHRGSVGTVTDCGLDDLGVGLRIFPPPSRLDRLEGPPSLPFNRYRAFFLGVKRLVREADHFRASSVDVKKT
jgi:hypothetical protein